jgi:hypothetical protein
VCLYHKLAERGRGGNEWASYARTIGISCDGDYTHTFSPVQLTCTPSLSIMTDVVSVNAN